MKIKILEEDDWKSFKNIRLEALQNSPVNFGSSFEIESGWDETKFKQIISDNLIFGTFINEEIIASAAVSSNPKPRRIHIGEIWAVYTNPEYRGRKIIVNLLAELIKYSKDYYLQLKLSVNTDNKYALKAYQSLGFIEYGREPRALKIGNRFEDITLMNLILDSDDQFWSNQDKFIPPSDFQFNNKFESKDSVSEYLGQSGIEIAESKYELTESENSPVLELIGSTGHSSRDSLKFGSTGHEITLGLNLSIPISGRFLTRRKLSKARVAIEKAELLKHKLTKQQKNQFLTESFKLNQAEKTLKLQQELWRLQKERLDKIISMFSKRMSEKSVILMERETLLRREMFLELSRISYIKQKYILDLIQ